MSTAEKPRATPSQAYASNTSYQDKDDVAFLEEVESTLLLGGGGDSSSPSSKSKIDNDNLNEEEHEYPGAGTKASRASTAVNSPRHPLSPSSSSSGHDRGGSNGNSGMHLLHSQLSPDYYLQDDPSSFRRKCRAGIFYLICSTLHELAIYKLAQRTTVSIAVAFIPFEFIIFTVLGAVATLYMRKTSNLKMQHAIGLNGMPILPSLAWKESIPLAALVIAAATLRVLKDANLEASISNAVSTYTAPALLLILPLIYLSTEIPRNGFLILSAVAVPTLYGLAVTDLPVLSSAILSALAFTIVEAGKLALAKKWFVSRNGSPLEAMLNYLPPATIIALICLLPPARMTGKMDRLPYKWHLYFISHVVTSLLNQISTLIAVNAFSSPVSIALLTVPKGLLVTLANGGILQGHERASHSIFVTFCISSLIIAFATPEIRNRLNGSRHQQAGPLPNHSGKSEHESASSAVYVSPKAIRYLSIASFAPMLYWFISQVATSPINLNERVETLRFYTHSPTVDIVISYFDEELPSVHHFIDSLRYYPWIKNRDPRIIIYSKTPPENITYTDAEFLAATGADQVYHMVNRGREAGAYIRHIINNYNASIDPRSAQTYRPAGLADHTLFMQPHLAWDWIARERLWLFQSNTGYLHFAPYLKLDCGKDMNGNGDFPRLREVYNIFAEELCPPTLQLGAYSSQFVVSKERILANPYHKYQGLADILESDASHWIHQEGTWWKYHGEPGPSNPYFGHAMERAWPTIFGCSNPDISDTCAGENYNITGCQCFD
ncbi:hypothetical protein P389DRAFT_173903 [Cystobasidium minutum MCA 4210]|uniref:uncharacterized protein n=1 Tax=Cystobasidium minutum MCA 4210 TaxID=1397322 RepID=UPI0034CF7747|eukprot:jgi/Rhomi1/173903/fgenesh1_kg.6_\